MEEGKGEEGGEGRVSWICLSNIWSYLRHSYIACRAFATSMTSVCPSVTLVDCDRIVHQKWKSAHDRIGRCLLARRSRSGSYSIL